MSDRAGEDRASLNKIMKDTLILQLSFGNVPLELILPN